MPIRRTTKQSGELAELAFIYKAVSLGFTVSKPYGDSSPYDFVVGSGRRLVRVQVKSAHCHRRGAYYLSTSRRNTPYTRKYTFDDIDFIVAYVPPENAWYVIPLFAVSHTMAARVYPGRKNHPGRYERWRDCWDLLSRSRRNPPGGL